MAESKSMQLIIRASDIVNKLVENGGEITTDMQDLLDGLSADVAGYSDRVKYVIDELDSYSEKLGVKIKQLQSAKKALDNNKENLQERIKYVLSNAELTEAVGSDYIAKITPSQPKLVIDDESKIPADYFVITYELDKDQLKEALKSGAEVEGAKLEQSKTLRWSVNKGN